MSVSLIITVNTVHVLMQPHRTGHAQVQLQLYTFQPVVLVKTC